MGVSVFGNEKAWFVSRFDNLGKALRRASSA
jgi:hypothetical protein